MQTSNSEQILQEAISDLPREIDPKRDLWRGIELGIENSNFEPSVSKSQRPVWLASAASFVLVACLGWFFMQSEPGVNRDALNGTELVEALTSQHQNQLNTLLVTFDGQQAVTENWQQQLDELDNAADAIKAALDEDPTNSTLLGMLQHIYQQQINLVERVHSPKWQQI